MVCAQEAYWQLDLDEVVLMPVGQAPHRVIDGDPGPERRYELCLAAVGSAPWLSVSRAEVDREGPAYTVDTLEKLHAEQPDTELHFILGADQAQRITTWREPARVLELARLAVGERAGMPLEDVRAAVEEVGAKGRVTTFSMPRVDVSSTEVRDRVASGRPYRFLVPAGVAEAIEQGALYK
jgi:nicotinate-nucleotide adenylyltransferase